MTWSSPQTVSILRGRTIYCVQKYLEQLHQSCLTSIRSPGNANTELRLKLLGSLKMTCKVQSQLFNQFCNGCIDRLNTFSITYTHWNGFPLRRILFLLFIGQVLFQKEQKGVGPWVLVHPLFGVDNVLWVTDILLLYTGLSVHVIIHLLYGFYLSLKKLIASSVQMQLI